MGQTGHLLMTGCSSRSLMKDSGIWEGLEVMLEKESRILS